MRKYNHKRREKEGNNLKLPLVVAVVIVLLLLSILFVFFKVLTLGKFVYVNKLNDGSSEIVIVDPQEDDVVKYLFSSDINVDSSRNYGIYKLGNLWSLSQKDPIKGRLVTETITKNFAIPIFLWKDGKDTNLSFYQKIKSLLIEKRKIGYQSRIDTNKLPESLYINFVNSEMVDSTPSVELDDLTGEPDLIDKVSRIIDVFGGKITSNSKGYEKDLECEISGKNREIVKSFAKIFECKINDDDNMLITDVRIRLGAKFAERF
jgi:hypothetical protein